MEGHLLFVRSLVEATEGAAFTSCSLDARLSLLRMVGGTYEAPSALGLRVPSPLHG